MSDRDVVVNLIGHDKASQAFRSAGRSAKAAEKDFNDLDKTGARLGQVSNVLAGMAAAAQALGPGVAAVGQLAGALGAATGTLLAVPAAAGSAAAAFATVRVGVLGVGDALKNGLDPDKTKQFAVALKNLAPSARSFVQEIVKLQPAFNGLRLNVQQRLFSGLAGSVRLLASRWLPILNTGMQKVAAGLATARRPLQQALGDKATLSVAQHVFDATAGAARALSGAIGPVVSIVRDLVDVGTSFLPGFAGGFTRAAQAAAAWVHTMAETGQLRQWLQGGLQALGELRDMAVRAAAAFRDVLLPPLRAVAGFLTAHKDDLAQFAAGLAAAAVAVRGLSTISSAVGAIAALANPVGLIVVGIAALGIAFGAAYTYIKPFHDWVNALASQALPAFQAAISAVAGYWNTSLGPALQHAGEAILPKLAAVWQTLVQSFGAGTPAFNFVIAAFKIIGSFVANVVVPVVSNLAQLFLSVVAPAISQIGWVVNNIVVPAFKFLLQAFNIAVGSILQGAATMFGWVPGVGPKLQAAAARFDIFRNDVNNALGGITRNVDVTVTTYYREVVGTPGSGRDEGATPHPGYHPAAPRRSTPRRGVRSIATPPPTPSFRATPITPTSLTGGSGASSRAASRATAARNAAKAAFRAASYVSTGGGFWKQIHGDATKVTAAFEYLATQVKASGNKHAAAIVAAARKQLGALAGTHDMIVKRLKAAQTKLADLQKQAADLTRQVREQIISSASVAAQEGGDYSFGAVIDRLQRGVAFARQFAAAMARLRAAGLNNDAIQQLTALGPEQGYEQATGILAGGKGGIAQINALQKQLGQAGQSLGATAASSMYAAGIHAAEGLVKGLQRQEKALESQMVRLGSVMARALKKALGIRSPSRVFAEVGSHIGTGLALGIDGSRPIVKRSVGRLVAVPAGGSIGAGRRAAGGPFELHQHFYGDVIDKREVARLAAQGAASASRSGVRTGGLRQPAQRR